MSKAARNQLNCIQSENAINSNCVLRLKRWELPATTTKRFNLWENIVESFTNIFTDTTCRTDMEFCK